MSEPTVSFVPSPGPDSAACSRVTNPERFLPLHTLALALLDRLALEYEVLRTGVFTSIPNVTPFDQPRPPITLTPIASGASADPPPT